MVELIFELPAGMEYEAGDQLEVHPQNDPELVARVASRLLGGFATVLQSVEAGGSEITAAGELRAELRRGDAVYFYGSSAVLNNGACYYAEPLGPRTLRLYRKPQVRPLRSRPSRRPAVKFSAACQLAFQALAVDGAAGLYSHGLYSCGRSCSSR